MQNDFHRLTEEEFDEKQRIKEIGISWLSRENLLYCVFSTHSVIPNNNMGCTFRTGQGRIEFNPKYTKVYDNKTLEELLKVEVMRIILKHPYSRCQENIRDDASVCASDVTIVQNCNVKIDVPNEIRTCDNFGIPNGYCYEEYCKILTQLFDNMPPNDNAEKSKINSNESQNANDSNSKGSGGGVAQDLQNISDNAKERSELWEEDLFMDDLIQEEINNNISQKSCGSVPGNFIQYISADKKPKLPYKEVLSQFRASLISDKKKLTRMRPSRRYGFKQMGSRYDYMTNILVAVDTSGSISDLDLKKFFSAINQFFKYGVNKLDVIQFDCKIQGDVQSLRKSIPKIKVRGRGGTDFQIVYDYCVQHNEYNGLIFLTDGFACQPKVPDTFRMRVVWVLDNKRDFEINLWLKKFGFTTYIQDS